MKQAAQKQELCPVWTRRLRGPFNEKYDTALQDPKMCFVGEAYGWSDEYVNDKLCNECDDFGVSISTTYWEGNEPAARAVARQFKAHFKRVHRK